jgi:hypothetical protein
MKQPYPVVASMVVAGKYVGSGGVDNLAACVTSIIGMSNNQTVQKMPTSHV